jgi:hypothetical protein
MSYFASFAGKSAKVESGSRFAAHLTLLIHLFETKNKILMKNDIV